MGRWVALRPRQRRPPRPIDTAQLERVAKLRVALPFTFYQNYIDNIT
jgi:hypothetical protein